MCSVEHPNVSSFSYKIILQRRCYYCPPLKGEEYMSLKGNLMLQVWEPHGAVPISYTQAFQSLNKSCGSLVGSLATAI